jgi:hypothetical protein
MVSLTKFSGRRTRRPPFRFPAERIGRASGNKKAAGAAQRYHLIRVKQGRQFPNVGNDADIQLQPISSTGANAITNHYDGKHHVIVVDEKNELFLSLWEFRRHAEYEVFNLVLQLGQQLIDAVTGETLIQANERSRKFGISSRDLHSEINHNSSNFSLHTEITKWVQLLNKASKEPINCTNVRTLHKQN